MLSTPFLLLKPHSAVVPHNAVASVTLRTCPVAGSSCSRCSSWRCCRRKRSGKSDGCRAPRYPASPRDRRGWGPWRCNWRSGRLPVLTNALRAALLGANRRPTRNVAELPIKSITYDSRTERLRGRFVQTTAGSRTNCQQRVERGQTARSGERTRYARTRRPSVPGSRTDAKGRATT